MPKSSSSNSRTLLILWRWLKRCAGEIIACEKFLDPRRALWRAIASRRINLNRFLVGVLFFSFRHLRRRHFSLILRGASPSTPNNKRDEAQHPPKCPKQSFLRSLDQLKVPLELKIMTMCRGTDLGLPD